MGRLVIVSNRVPSPRERGSFAGGLAVALREAIARRETLWFGWSGNTVSGETPEEASLTRAGRVTFATLDVNEKDFSGYYAGFSNGMLWPLLHYRSGLAEFKRSDLQAYRAVNRSFARALTSLLRPDDVIWVHDYHLIPLGAALRRLGVRSPHRIFPPRSFSAFAALRFLPQREAACCRISSPMT